MACLPLCMAVSSAVTFCCQTWTKMVFPLIAHPISWLAPTGRGRSCSFFLNPSCTGSGTYQTVLWASLMHSDVTKSLLFTILSWIYGQETASLMGIGGKEKTTGIIPLFFLHLRMWKIKSVQECCCSTTAEIMGFLFVPLIKHMRVTCVNCYGEEVRPLHVWCLRVCVNSASGL